jgi:hypothetical protein
MDFSDVEKAVEILTNPIVNHDPAVKKQANDYLLEVVEQNVDKWSQFFEYFEKLCEQR